jgi:alpha-L-fucosidase 2
VFIRNFLIEEPTHKWLVVSPAISPENAPAGRTSLCWSNHGQSILFDLFSKTIKTASLLNKDAELMGEFKKNTRPFAADAIGQHGQLQEWIEDLDNPKTNTAMCLIVRTLSSNQITPYATPELFDAARNTL